MQEPSALGRVVELVRDLRARCPWDAAQTPQTLRPYFVEEAMELDRAMGEPDAGPLRSELGDVMLHVAFQIVLAEERGAFGADDLTRAIEAKMWRRHPGLFPAGEHDLPETSAEKPGRPVSPDRPVDASHAAWERNKAAELPQGASILDGLPATLPALVEAYRLQEKTAGVGFDWPDTVGPLAKVREETEEVAVELDGGSRPDRLESEIGDLLFAVVNLARKAGVDPRAALERANRRFADRFRRIERLARERGVDLHTAGLEILDGLWEEVKRGR